jgi:hypothetical protein
MSLDRKRGKPPACCSTQRNGLFANGLLPEQRPGGAGERAGLTHGQVRYWLGRFRQDGLSIFPEGEEAETTETKAAEAAKKPKKKKKQKKKTAKAKKTQKTKAKKKPKKKNAKKKGKG